MEWLGFVLREDVDFPYENEHLRGRKV